MKRFLTIIAIIFLAAPMAMAQDAPASLEESEQPTSVTDVRTYVLEHVDVADAARLIETLLPQHSNLKVVPDSKTNSLYIQAGPEEQKSIGDLISNIDVSVAQRRSLATVTEQIRLNQVEAQEVLRVVDSLGLQDLTVAVAPNSNSLLARGSSESIAGLKQLIEQIDTPPQRSSAVDQSGSKDLEKIVVVTLNRAGQAIVAGRVTTTAQLESMLGPDSAVEIYVDHDASYDKVAQLIDRFKALRVGRVGVRIKQEKIADRWPQVRRLPLR